MGTGLVVLLLPAMKPLRIVFLGTPDFAAASLRKLVENGCNVVAVVTAPDKPKGRGKQLASSAVKEYAVSVGLPVLQPTNLKSPEFLEELKSHRADLQIVVAFRMLPEVVWNMPLLGTFNLHASLLPNYRGAAPINWAVINGEKETGVTTFFLKHEIDTGKIIFQERAPISPNDTAGTLHDRLMGLGADLVLKTVKAIEVGEYPQIEQEDSLILKSAPKIFREDCEINWNQPAGTIRNFVRGLAPYPAAWTTLKGENLKVFEVKPSTQQGRGEIGTFESDGKTYLRVVVADGSLEITELQLEGKRRMDVWTFLRGYQL
jgi:methionyl-tRNA formyltransferase